MIPAGVRAIASGVDVGVEPFPTLGGPSADILDDRNDIKSVSTGQPVETAGL